MGYTRYWNRTDKLITEAFVLGVLEIIGESEAMGIRIRDAWGENEPIVKKDYIALNGNSEHNLDHESCAFDNERTGFDFCKTARKPYDYTVQRVLALAEALGIVTDVRDDGYNGIRTDKEYLDGKEAVWQIENGEKEEPGPLF